MSDMPEDYTHYPFTGTPEGPRTDAPATGEADRQLLPTDGLTVPSAPNDDPHTTTYDSDVDAVDGQPAPSAPHFVNEAQAPDETDGAKEQDTHPSLPATPIGRSALSMTVDQPDTGEANDASLAKDSGPDLPEVPDTTPASGDSAPADSAAENADRADDTPRSGDSPPDGPPPPGDIPPTNGGEDEPPLTPEQVYWRFEDATRPSPVVGRQRFAAEMEEVLDGIGFDPARDKKVFTAFGVEPGHVIKTTPPLRPGALAEAIETDDIPETTVEMEAGVPPLAEVIHTVVRGQLESFTDNYNLVVGARRAAEILHNTTTLYQDRGIALEIEKRYIDNDRPLYPGQFQVAATDQGVKVTEPFEGEDWMFENRLVKHALPNGETQLINTDSSERYRVLPLQAQPGEGPAAVVTHEIVVAPREEDVLYFEGLRDILAKHESRLLEAAQTAGADTSILTTPNKPYGEEEEVDRIVKMEAINRTVTEWANTPDSTDSIQALKQTAVLVHYALQHMDPTMDPPRLRGLGTITPRIMTYFRELLARQ